MIGVQRNLNEYDPDIKLTAHIKAAGTRFYRKYGKLPEVVHAASNVVKEDTVIAGLPVIRTNYQRQSHILVGVEE